MSETEGAVKKKIFNFLFYSPLSFLAVRQMLNKLRLWTFFFYEIRLKH